MPDPTRRTFLSNIASASTVGFIGILLESCFSKPRHAVVKIGATIPNDAGDHSGKTHIEGILANGSHVVLVFNSNGQGKIPIGGSYVKLDYLKNNSASWSVLWFTPCPQSEFTASLPGGSVGRGY